jgi:hypothetical protein
MAIFTLKNLGWRDNPEIELNISGPDQAISISGKEIKF